MTRRPPRVRYVGANSAVVIRKLCFVFYDAGIQLYDIGTLQ